MHYNKCVKCISVLLLKIKKNIKRFSMPRKCKVCNIKFEPKYSSVQEVCSYQCAIKKAEKERLKNSKDLEELRTQRKNKSELETLKKNVVKICHEYIRERDKGKPCVSCGQPWNSEHQAGHFYKAGDYSNLKYNENNIHNQCKGCNLMKDGNENQYRIKITKRITKQELTELDQMASDYKKSSFKWDREELKKIRTYYREKLKQLKKSI